MAAALADITLAIVVVLLGTIKIPAGKGCDARLG
jgi:hypothetical protein